MSSLPKAYFDYNTLKAKVGNSYKGYEELSCLQVPTFTKTVLERSDEGGGWYGAKEKVTKKYDKFFVILKDNKPYGVLLEPYNITIASDIHPINKKFYFKEINDFINFLLQVSH